MIVGVGVWVRVGDDAGEVEGGNKGVDKVRMGWPVLSEERV